MIDKIARSTCDNRAEGQRLADKNIWETIRTMHDRLKNQQDQIISLQGQVKVLTDKVFPRCGECGQAIPPRRLIGDPPRNLMKDIADAPTPGMGSPPLYGEAGQVEPERVKEPRYTDSMVGLKY